MYRKQKHSIIEDQQLRSPLRCIDTIVMERSRGHIKHTNGQVVPHLKALICNYLDIGGGRLSSTFNVGQVLLKSAVF